MKKEMGILLSAILGAQMIPAAAVSKPVSLVQPVIRKMAEIVSSSSNLAMLKTEERPVFGPYVLRVEETNDRKEDLNDEPQQPVWIEETIEEVKADGQNGFDQSLFETYVWQTAEFEEDESQQDSQEIAVLLSRIESMRQQIAALQEISKEESDLPSQTEDADLNEKLVLLQEELESLLMQKEKLIAELENLVGQRVNSAKEPENPEANVTAEAAPETSSGDTAEETQESEEADPVETEDQVLLEEQIAQLQEQIAAIDTQIAVIEQQITEAAEQLDSQKVQQKSADAIQSGEPVSAEGMETNGSMPGMTPNFHLVRQQVLDLDVQISEADNSAPELLAQWQQQLDQLQKQLKAMETTAVHRLYNPNSGEHFYTTDTEESEHLQTLGWRYENIGWYTPANDQSKPVFRLYNPNAGDHHYTPDAEERDHLVSVGWNDEGISWYDDAWKGVQVLRIYNPNAKTGSHHFTTSEIERDYLVGRGWRSENIGFHARFIYSICNKIINGKPEIVWYDQDDRQMTGTVKVQGYWYCFDEQTGAQQHGLTKDSQTGKVRYYRADGRHARKLTQVDDDSYYFDDESGYALANQFRSVNGGSVRYFGTDGKALKSMFYKDGIAFVPDVQGNIVRVDFGDLPLYMQTDPRWANAIVNGMYFRGTGCLPTVLTSVINRFTSNSITPNQLGWQLGAHGLMNATGAGTSAHGLIWASDLYGLQVHGNLTLQAAKEILCKGGLIMAAMNPGIFSRAPYTHEVLVYGYDNGKVHVHDPYWPEHSGVYDLSIMFAQHSTDPDDCAYGGPIFGFANPYIV